MISDIVTYQQLPDVDDYNAVTIKYNSTFECI